MRVLLISLLFLLFSCAKNNAKQAASQPVVPQWAKEVVWYQIFPERFSNGDCFNDPTPQDMKGGWPYFTPKNWRISPWTSDWYKLQPWEKIKGKDFYGIQGMRRYGGDLQGVLEHLDYLQELGITGIYFNPLFESPSSHKYDTAMYHHIDNNFGPDPERDRAIWAKENPADPATWQWTSADSLFLELIKVCHQRGIRVIIDGVFNHVGATFWAFQDVEKNQQKSYFKDWFVINKWDNPKTKENEFEFGGWYGIKDLPEINEDENGLKAGPRAHIHAVVKRWGDPNGDGDPSDGIDGWRLDVAEMVKMGFWKDFRKWVKEINPEAFISGEIWWEDWPKNKMFNAAPWLQGDAFDAVMNYRFGRALRQFVANQKTRISVSAFVDSLKSISNDYPPENRYVLQNLVDSHDMERLASQIVNPDIWVDHGGNPAQTANWNVRKPNFTERLKQRLIVGLQMTLPGAPMIYYGDEAGMWGGDDPDCRKPMVWPDFKYETETTHPLGKKRPADVVAFDREMFNWYKKLISLRTKHKALSLGTVRFFLIDNDRNLLGFIRGLNSEKIYVLLNNGSEAREVLLSKTDTGIFLKEITDLISGTKVVRSQAVFKIALAPFQILILK